ncbi:MAG TPA: hypothetical protein VG456_07940 [Candidatus Sulfopaludibacter sp.]|jgi:hypothetical protein|nr:hypothetical protein [Candidatus Sulfopaludibacter sp.]
MWDFNQPYFDGNLIPAEDAWRRFDAWMADGKQIGVWFVAKSGSLRTSGFVKSARDGRVQLKGQTAQAAFHLEDARFTYGPFQVFPNWPAGPMVELMAVQAFLTNGDWLVLAEGLKPEGISPLALPA